MPSLEPTPVTIFTGFLGSGKTTLILSLLPQLPKNYKLALLKNEFGDVAVDSELASQSSISGVKELLNGCICCNLVGQLGNALKALRAGVEALDETPSENLEPFQQNVRAPDRIIIETSGSAFPATLAMEVNRLSRETGAFVLDGVVSVIDVENWQGYEDTSVTAKMQAKFTDLLILNKHESVSERRLDEVLDRIGDLNNDPPTPKVKSDRGRVESEVILGLDGSLAQSFEQKSTEPHSHHDPAHQTEVEVISATLTSQSNDDSVDLAHLENFLRSAPKDEVYRIKGLVRCTDIPTSSEGEKAVNSSKVTEHSKPSQYILNWAFGRWTFTFLRAPGTDREVGTNTILRLTIVTAPYEASKWIRRIESGEWLRNASHSQLHTLQMQRVG